MTWRRVPAAVSEALPWIDLAVEVVVLAVLAAVLAVLWKVNRGLGALFDLLHDLRLELERAEALRQELEESGERGET